MELETLRAAGAYDGPPPQLPALKLETDPRAGYDDHRPCPDCLWKDGEPQTLTAAIADLIEWTPILYTRYVAGGRYEEAARLAGAIRQLAAHGCALTRAGYGSFSLPPAGSSGGQ